MRSHEAARRPNYLLGYIGILSALFHDTHSTIATSHARREGFHLVASLGWAEAHAVMSRIEREGTLAKTLVDAARATFDAGPWRRMYSEPNWKSIALLARMWPLRGADLWHLAAAKALYANIPELTFLSFDQRLYQAAQGEGLVHAASAFG